MKRIFLSAIVFVFVLSGTVNVWAQAPDWLWSTNAGYNSYDESLSIDYDHHGNCYVVGYYNTYIYNLPHSNGPDGFIAKYNLAGTLIYTAAISDTGRERITNIAFDKLGNYYIVGTFDGPKLELCNESFVNAANNATDIFIAKFDSTDQCIWARHAGGTDDEMPTGLAVDSIGNCYITGSFNSPSISFGAFPLINSGGGNSDLFIAKYDSAGTALWARSADGTVGSAETSKSIAIDKTGNCYITGSTNADSLWFDTFLLKKVTNFNMYFAKFAPDGSALWAIRSAGTGDSQGNTVTVDGESNCYLAGSFKNNITFGDTTLTSAGYRDVFIVKYDADTNVQWARAAGGSADDEGSVVATDKLGYSYLTGYFKSDSISFGTWPLANNGSGFSDIFITEYEPNGTIAWAKSIGGATNDTPNDIAPDESRNFIIAASFGSTAITIGDTTLYNAGTVDVLVAKSGNTPASGIAEAVAQSGTIIYPNPASDFIVVSSDQNSTIEIMNMQGQVIKTVNSKMGETRISVSEFPAGIYLVNIRNDNSFQTFKLIKL
ncbi:MAG: SBBP repeat-containing protein [Bacteroidota bacterium]